MRAAGEPSSLAGLGTDKGEDLPPGFSSGHAGARVQGDAAGAAVRDPLQTPAPASALPSSSPRTPTHRWASGSTDIFQPLPQSGAGNAAITSFVLTRGWQRGDAEAQAGKSDVGTARPTAPRCYRAPHRPPPPRGSSFPAVLSNQRVVSIAQKVLVFHVKGQG